MRKTTRYLEYVNFREKTIKREKVTAYPFVAKTKDGADIELFVYRNPQNLEEWRVNDDIGANATVSNARYSRRKDAVDDIKRLMLTINGSLVFEKVREAKENKAGLEVIS